MFRRRVFCPCNRSHFRNTLITVIISNPDRTLVEAVTNTMSRFQKQQEFELWRNNNNNNEVSRNSTEFNELRSLYHCGSISISSSSNINVLLSFRQKVLNYAMESKLEHTSALCTSRRMIKVLDVREYKPLFQPIEFRFYQRYANHPNRASGVQFLTHYDNHKRFHIHKDYIDYLHWGKEQGQARLPHRHQRVAFDFNDVLHPTRVSEEENSTAWFRHQDPSMSYPLELSSTFDPNYQPFSHPEHWNKMFSLRRPGEGDIKPWATDSHNLLGPLLTQTDTQSERKFNVDPRGPYEGKVPGVNAPFIGAFDHKMMQAMSKPLNSSNTLTANNGRFSKLIYINDPKRHQALSGHLAKELNVEIDKATNAVYAKLTVIEAAQSGLTDYFCAGVDWERVGFDLVMAAKLRQEAEAIRHGVTPVTSDNVKESTETCNRDSHTSEMKEDKPYKVNGNMNNDNDDDNNNIESKETIHNKGVAVEKEEEKEEEQQQQKKKIINRTQHKSTCNGWLTLCDNLQYTNPEAHIPSTTNTGIHHNSNNLQVHDNRVEREVHVLLRDASRYEDRVNQTLREHAALLWRAYAAPRPLMALVNGRCQNTGCGLALATKYCALTENSEFICDGVEVGLIPFNGPMMRLLSREETALKFPGLAEFVVLTGSSLFAGDVLKLGWTDLFTALPDMSYYIKEWFNQSEHMHQDAVAWQLGHLLETCFKMKSHHGALMERCAISPRRARWIEDAFADQLSMSSIMHTLSEMEIMPIPYDDAPSHNTMDAIECTPFTISHVKEAIAMLHSTQLHYSLSPWDMTAPEEPIALNEAASLYLQYVLEKHSSSDIAIHSHRYKLQRWKEQREREYGSYKSLKSAPYIRHVFVRVEGCENVLVHFDYTFDLEASHAQRVLERQHVREQQQNTFSSDTTTTTTTISIKSNNSNNNSKDEEEREEETCTQDACLYFFKQRTLEELKMPVHREVVIGWYLPTLDTCPLYTDADLIEALHHDPAIEDAAMNLTYPPIYFIMKRCSFYLSEWAYAVKHQLLLQCPFALEASLALLQEIRGTDEHSGTSETSTSNSNSINSSNNNNNNNNNNSNNSNNVGVNSDSSINSQTKSLDACLALEYQYVMRLMKRNDFVNVGQYVNKDGLWWDHVKYERTHNLHKVHVPLRPLPDYEDVFERNVTLHNHTFQLRPRWQPRTLEEVQSSEIDALRASVKYNHDGFCALTPSVYCGKCDRVEGMVEDAGGLEVIPHLGEVVEESNNSGSHNNKIINNKVAPLQENAFVPQNVNFYEMARHPWNERASSWRQSGFTQGSEEYFKEQYQKAERAVYDETQRNVYNYWPSTSAVKGVSEEENNALLQERLFHKLHQVEKQVEPWARQLRSEALSNKLKYRTEIATQEEKIYDDEYYRWFIQPGHHPNPSGLVFGHKGKSTSRSNNNTNNSNSNNKSEDSNAQHIEDSAELELFLKTMLESVNLDVESGTSKNNVSDVLSETDVLAEEGQSVVNEEFDVTVEDQQGAPLEPFIDE